MQEQKQTLPSQSASLSPMPQTNRQDPFTQGKNTNRNHQKQRRKEMMAMIDTADDCTEKTRKER